MRAQRAGQREIYETVAYYVQHLVASQPVSHPGRRPSGPSPGEAWPQSVHFDFTCLPQRLNERARCANCIGSAWALIDFLIGLSRRGSRWGERGVLCCWPLNVPAFIWYPYGDFAIATVRDICVKCVQRESCVGIYSQAETTTTSIQHTHTHTVVHTCVQSFHLCDFVHAISLKVATTNENARQTQNRKYCQKKYRRA